jgi:hypothetical protein
MCLVESSFHAPLVSYPPESEFPDVANVQEQEKTRLGPQLGGS